MAAMLLGLTVFSYFISAVSRAVEMVNAASMRSKEQRRVCPSLALDPFVPRRRRLPSDGRRQRGGTHDDVQQQEACAFLSE